MEFRTRARSLWPPHWKDTAERVRAGAGMDPGSPERRGGAASEDRGAGLRLECGTPWVLHTLLSPKVVVSVDVNLLMVKPWCPIAFSWRPALCRKKPQGLKMVDLFSLEPLLIILG